MIGIIPIYINKNKEQKIIPVSLAFSSGVMLTISILSLIPESVTLISNYFYNIPSFIITFMFIVLGILFSIYIDKGIEKKITNNNLYKLGIISIIVLMFHNIPEDCSCYVSHKKYNIGLK